MHNAGVGNIHPLPLMKAFFSFRSFLSRSAAGLYDSDYMPQLFPYMVEENSLEKLFLADRREILRKMCVNRVHCPVLFTWEVASNGAFSVNWSLLQKSILGEFIHNHNSGADSIPVNFLLGIPP